MEIQKSFGRKSWRTWNCFECPNFVEINGKHVLFMSPHGMNYRKSIYLVGDFDYITGKFFWHNYGEIDWGMDYYAPQIITNERGEKISIGWMEQLGLDAVE